MSTPADKGPPTWSPEQISKAQDWLQKKWGTRGCPMCGKRSWTVATSPAMIPIGKPDGGMIIGPNYPAIAIVCNICANMNFVSAVLAGLTSGSTKKEPDNG